ncbi:MAG: hypothetical protein EOO63_18340 [Hymenobacter sp.]|nr:MAG: hypothetical protein EOO63_18340 [Hymenobacter sp.]
MQAPPTFSPESVAATETNLVPSVAPCPILAAVKARAKTLKKMRKHENKRLFLGWCSCLHALGFSF